MPATVLWSWSRRTRSSLLGIVAQLARGGVWAVLLSVGLDQLALVPIVVYALFKGSIEYVAPLTIRLALAAAYAGRPQRGAAVMSPARERGP